MLAQVDTTVQFVQPYVLNSVAPTRMLLGTTVIYESINQGDTLSLTNIGQFTDPGFDNALNIGGETSETFAFSIDWGDSSALDTGPGTVDVPGRRWRAIRLSLSPGRDSPRLSFTLFDGASPCRASRATACCRRCWTRVSAR